MKKTRHTEIIKRIAPALAILISFSPMLVSCVPSMLATKMLKVALQPTNTSRDTAETKSKNILTWAPGGTVCAKREQCATRSLPRPTMPIYTHYI